MTGSVVPNHNNHFILVLFLGQEMGTKKWGQQRNGDNKEMGTTKKWGQQRNGDRHHLAEMITTKKWGQTPFS
ncbi:MAG: hypothetical protein A3H57_04400 [Candidatus Taylorbacteria bacterium RIFCSPLOWO2_02_FULL_43_11]|uniref:Uncharacterized protein n=1 Tax=Candidatus Taylorbacteria bacterium RIFCSPHIGHO2_02_FULL_43_32b TaxID=1802306 RepID=A0A1G2MEW3_9BACT|nr:MAG: hypothetical protein A3C72_03350 [Candidatus Taylorbacteria bacterium RIFCSPHIGHO2_02_FULL_43_32b]OHA31624.1 MAG: hypothetical protein A3B08_04055 [Candidatus Taylorbacteria bacterium RIFCSPLOWO2_01_FULL_43_44]OHA36205.1 MAG: hypothetical protein A3H57_04400 [Candidatus Taylorbacteria bacterium RIFCSPLOWO2_02_FULL_43_11]